MSHRCFLFIEMLTTTTLLNSHVNFSLRIYMYFDPIFYCLVQIFISPAKNDLGAVFFAGDKV